MSGTYASEGATGKSADRRKLVAVVYADMVGYSRLIGLDDAGTLARLRALRRNLIDPAIEENGGRIVQTGGDSLLIVFDSIDGAVRCAVKVQQEIPAHDGDQPSDRAIRFRIGINIGDAIADGTDLHGEAVNVVARLQAECSPGRICVSRSVREHVHGRLGLEFEELGALNFKNIARPVEAFLVRTDSSVTEAMEVGPLPLPDRPSIAVLPFQNMSADPEQEYFADGIVEEIITALSRIPSFFVIARNSSFAYKGRSPDVRQVGEELGVRYVLEGSVRKAGSRIRITGQLVEATSGAHLWADRFDGDLTDIFHLQDQVTFSVVGAIEPTIRMAEIERALRKGTGSVAAYDLIMRGRWYLQFGGKDRLEKTADLCRCAIELDPNYALAYALLARTLFVFVAYQITMPSEEELSEYVTLARTAVRLGQADPEALAYAAHIIALPGGDLLEGIAIVSRALAQNPNSADALAVSGTLHAFCGDTETAFRHLEATDRLNPLGLFNLTKTFGLVLACFVDGNYAGVLDWTGQSLSKYPTNIIALRYRIAALGLLGRLVEARQTVDRLLAVSPGLTISRCRRHVEVEMKNPYKRPGVAEAYYEGLRLAGLPE
jgi:adenylate cyclase